MNAIADLPPGFASPGPASQLVFRCVLDALSRPGRVRALPPEAIAVLTPPPPMGAALAALLLTLLDAEVSIWLGPAFDTPLLRHWLAFHTGVAVAAQPERARFVALRAGELDAALWPRLARGSDEAPHDGATVLVDVPALDRGCPLQLSGPGIATPMPFAADGIARELWQLRRDELPRYPLGVDLLLCSGDRVAGLPRSTRVALEG